MGLSVFHGTPTLDEERFKVLDRVIEIGSTFIDSSDGYGVNEDLLGKYFKKYPQQREKVFLATKFGNIFLPDGARCVHGDAQYVREANTKSLKRLVLDFIDLYYVHRIDKNVSIEETMGVLKELVQEGKIKYIGLSECLNDTLRRVYSVHAIAAIQTEYSPFSLDVEREDISLLKTCRELDVAIICYSPLSRGILTGQIKRPNDLEENDFRRKMSRFFKENFDKNLHLVETLTKIAKQKNCTPGQPAFAWILAQGDDFIVIPGTTKIKNLEENVAAAQIKLSKEEEEEIRKACENADIDGGRYPEAVAAFLFADSAPKKNETNN